MHKITHLSKNQETEMILGFPREIKIQCMKDALAKNDIGMFLGLSKIFLDAPIIEGGIESEVLDALYQDYLHSPQS
jgi:hypothetical protein